MTVNALVARSKKCSKKTRVSKKRTLQGGKRTSIKRTSIKKRKTSVKGGRRTSIKKRRTSIKGGKRSKKSKKGCGCAHKHAIQSGGGNKKLNAKFFLL